MADIDEDVALEELLDAMLWVVRVVMFAEERGVEKVVVGLCDAGELIIRN